MTLTDRRLLRHLAMAIVIKLVLLAGLWWGFVRDHRMAIDNDAVAIHVASPATPPAQGVSQ